MDFPVRSFEPIPVPPQLAQDEVLANEFNYMAILESEKLLLGSLLRTWQAVARVGRPGVIVTAPAQGAFDFVSSYFAPAKGIREDGVTGAAHCMLVPYWAKRLDKKEFRAFQASQRGGEIVCRLLNERIELEGECVFYMEGEVEL